MNGIPYRIAASILVCASMALGAVKTGSAPASSVFAKDKGKFLIQQNGETVGHEEFEIAPSEGNWKATGTTDIKVADSPATHVTGTLLLRADGAPLIYDWTSHADKTNGAHVVFANGSATITLHLQGADPKYPFIQDMSFGTSLVAVLDNNLYHQYAVLARIYDWSKGGVQTMSVVIPQELTPGSITIQPASALSAEGKSYEGLRVTTSDLEVVLYLDATHRLMRLEVPAVKVSVVRE